MLLDKTQLAAALLAIWKSELSKPTDRNGDAQ